VVWNSRGLHSARIMLVSFLFDCCVLLLNDTLYTQNVSWIRSHRSAMPGTQQWQLSPPTPTLSATLCNVKTHRRSTSCQLLIMLHTVQSAKYWAIVFSV